MRFMNLPGQLVTQVNVHCLFYIHFKSLNVFVAANPDHQCAQSISHPKYLKQFRNFRAVK